MTKIEIGNDKKSVMTKIEVGYVSYVKKSVMTKIRIGYVSYVEKSVMTKIKILDY